MAEQSDITPIIHQIWHDKDVPPRCQAWVESWRRHHPGWEYRLWTQVECRALLAEHYRWFLPIYDRYPEGVMRAEAGRYFILDRFGGVYVDLDFECLRPVDALLAGQELVVGLEPQEHVQLLSAHRSGLPRLVGTGFLAARPGHPSWPMCTGSWWAAIPAPVRWTPPARSCSPGRSTRPPGTAGSPSWRRGRCIRC
ncbi:glycosyltransferase family 32 protein [Streptomyces hygroscopicus]|uniref:glycosyltransferase family 32 protein n=1 Tax=Streptomyces hygroscopicus TaxID=1912 RepID=UPI00379A1094